MSADAGAYAVLWDRVIGRLPPVEAARVLRSWAAILDPMGVAGHSSDSVFSSYAYPGDGPPYDRSEEHLLEILCDYITHDLDGKPLDPGADDYLDESGEDSARLRYVRGVLQAAEERGAVFRMERPDDGPQTAFYGPHLASLRRPPRVRPPAIITRPAFLRGVLCAYDRGDHEDLAKLWHYGQDVCVLMTPDTSPLLAELTARGFGVVSDKNGGTLRPPPAILALLSEPERVPTEPQR